MSITYNIGSEVAISVIGGKWKVVILCHLQEGTKRNSELKRLLPTITQKVLTQQLRELEADGLIHRRSYHQMPPRVEYSLSEYGASLSDALYELCLWGSKHAKHVNETEKEEKYILLKKEEPTKWSR